MNILIKIFDSIVACLDAVRDWFSGDDSSTAGWTSGDIDNYENFHQ